ncbi:major facilitator superfamily domain-containing protein [Xylariales sp. PMI_506]|nr:major facilitator superfamily domain-containing protein [Xylariales sp. PMI_506]
MSNERTTLLPSESTVDCVDHNSRPSAAHKDDDDEPLEKTQILVLCYARLVEPVAFFAIFPFVNKMVQENGGLTEADVGYYSGVIESLFSLTEMTVMIFWGRAADRIGRKTVLVYSLAGVSGATALFGMSRSIWQMILFRCAAGIFAGTVVTIRTMISENSNPRTQARAFSWFAISGNLGIFLGPLLGGMLAEPATQYPGIFGDMDFFRDYPYALPTIVTGLLGMSAVVISSIFLNETLKKGKNTAEGQNEEDLDIWEIFRAPGVGQVLFITAHAMLLAFSYFAVAPVCWFTPVELGGFGFTPFQISMFMGLLGLSQIIWLLMIFPPLQKAIGTGGVLRACAVAYPFCFLTCPLLNMLLRSDNNLAIAMFWVLGPVNISLGAGVCMGFTAVQLALNDICPTPESLGTLNAMALIISSAVRTFCPALFTSIFAIGASTQLLNGYLVWVILTCLGVGFTFNARHLPEEAEGSL